MTNVKDKLAAEFGGKSFWDSVQMPQAVISKNRQGNDYISSISFFRNNCQYKLQVANNRLTLPTLFIENKQRFIIQINKTKEDYLNKSVSYIYIVEDLQSAINLSSIGIENYIIIPREIKGDFAFGGNGKNETFVTLGYSEYIQKILRKQGAFYEWIDKDIDWNEYYETDQAGYEKTVKDLSTLKNCTELRQNRTALKDLDNFLEKLEVADANITKTGFQLLDKGMDGGLKPGLITIGAMSGGGKTTFISQLAEQVARLYNQPVYYLNLEMRREDMYKKSVKRQGMVNAIRTGDKSHSFTSCEILEPVKRDVVQEAIDDIKAYHNNIIYTNLDITTANIDDYIDEIKTNIADLNIRPLVVVDYLQILKGAKKYDNDKDRLTEVITKFKRLSDEFDLVIIMISSLNRASYSKGPTTLESFKGSGDIEYSSDTVFSLDFANQADATFNYDEEKRKTPRQMHLRLLKSRFLYMDPIHFEYYPQYDLFLETNLDTSKPTEIKEGSSTSSIDKSPRYQSNSTIIGIKGDELEENVRSILGKDTEIPSSGIKPAGFNENVDIASALNPKNPSNTSTDSFA